jgi:hypothetical protein
MSRFALGAAFDFDLRCRFGSCGIYSWLVLRAGRLDSISRATEIIRISEMRGFEERPRFENQNTQMKIKIRK